MTESQVISIFLQIVQDMAYEAGLQINTIAVIAEPPDLRADAFGKKYEDYLAGSYWRVSGPVYRTADSLPGMSGQPGAPL